MTSCFVMFCHPIQNFSWTKYFPIFGFTSGNKMKSLTPNMGHMPCRMLFKLEDKVWGLQFFLACASFLCTYNQISIPHCFWSYFLQLKSVLLSSWWNIQSQIKSISTSQTSTRHLGHSDGAVVRVLCCRMPICYLKSDSYLCV